MSDNPRIYVACLASYNAGILHGDWIELDGSEDLGERIAEILASSTIEDAEEWAVHDHEYCSNLGEYPGLDALGAIEAAYAEAEKHGIDWEAFVQYCEHLGHDLKANHIIDFQSHYAGSADTLVEWCQHHLDETGVLEALPENLRYYFNYEAYARDIEISDVLTIERNHEVLVFWQH